MSTTRRRRPALIALTVVAAIGCLGLAWWQWTRYESNSGTFQNLGYALQWPMFAGFCFYAYYKFVRYEDAPPPTPSEQRVTEIPAGLLPERPKAAAVDHDPTLTEYNAYLAELARTDRARADRPDQFDHPDDRTTP
jgi:DNA-binding transcriptional regulator of glucitol operon